MIYPSTINHLGAVLRFPLNYLGEVLTLAASTKVAVRRLDDFFARAPLGAFGGAFGGGGGGGPAVAVDMLEAALAGDSEASHGRAGCSAAAAPAAAAAAADAADAADGEVGVHTQASTAFWVGRVEGGRTDGCADGADDGAEVGSEVGATEGFCVRGVGLRVARGELAMVVGPVGSGKSVLLKGLLGETQRSADGTVAGGAVQLVGRVAFAAQVPFILNATVKHNILFGLPFDGARYARVLEACALATDLVQLPAGDATEIGERGVTLSGGQKQRVSLARLAYAAPDVAILDDPLSALDADTARRVFGALVGTRGGGGGGGGGQARCGGLLGNAAVVLSTHATQLLPEADSVVLLHGGETVFCGPRAKLRGVLGEELARLSAPRAAPERGGASSDHVGGDGGGSKVEGGATADHAPPKVSSDAQTLLSLVSQLHQDLTASSEHASRSAGEARLPSGQHPPISEEGGEGKEEGGVRAAPPAPLVPAASPAAAEAGGKLVEEELLGKGTLGWGTAFAWIRAAGGWKWAGLQAVLLGLDRASYIGIDWWLAKWTSAARGKVQAFGFECPEGVSLCRFLPPSPVAPYCRVRL